MRAKLLTLRFSPTLGRFDDASLVSLQQKIVLERLHQHLVTIAGEPLLLCVAEWREQVANAAPRPETVTPTADDTPTAPSSTPRQPARAVGDLRSELDAAQRAVFDQIRRWRSQKAHAEGAPPYVILTNRQLVEIVRQRPDTKAGLGGIDGLGDKKVERYGQDLLSLLWPSASDHASETSGEPAAEVAGA